jgi:hypothetical protein
MSRAKASGSSAMPRSRWKRVAAAGMSPADLRAALARGERRAEAGGPGADDEHVRGCVEGDARRVEDRAHRAAS